MNLFPTKKLIYGKEAREKFAAGVNQLAEAVAVTLGPKGRHVAIETEQGYFKITKDGVTVAQEVSLEDPFENGGAQIVLEAAQKTAQEAGDGTTTATVIAAEVFNVGRNLIDSESRYNPVLMKRGMDRAVDDLVELIKEKSRKITTDEEIKNIAKISANGETEISDLVTDAISRVGRDGHIVVDISQTKTGVKLIEGMRFTAGLHSNMMINDMEKMQCRFDDARILIWADKSGKAITSFANLTPILARMHKSDQPLVIVCDDLTGEALNGVIQNIVAKGMKVAAVKCPSMGEAKIAMLEDLAIAFGAKICGEDYGTKMLNLTEDHLGYCKKFSASQFDYCFIGSNVEPAVIKARIDSLESMMNSPEAHDSIKQLLRARINRLAGRIALISVSGDSIVEASERKDRVDDALCATKAAIDEGYLPGAGIFLSNMACYLENKNKAGNLEFKNEDECVGYAIVLQACKKPSRRILENAGLDISEVEEDIKKIIEGDDIAKTFADDIGMNLFTGQICNLVDAGVIDPAKVTRCALQNAVSVAGTMLTCDCIITKQRTKENELPMMPPMMGQPPPGMMMPQMNR